MAKVIAYASRIGPDCLVGAFAQQSGNHVMVAQARVKPGQYELARFYFKKLGLTADLSSEASDFAHALADRRWKQPVRSDCWVSEVFA